MATYYEILDLTAYQSRPGTIISLETLKSAYRKALLQNHPDKQTLGDSERKPGASPHHSVIPIDTLTLAFKTLSTPQLRAKYDLSLASSDNYVRTGTTYKTGIETIDLDSMPFDEKSNSWTRPCRCGNSFVVAEQELEQNVESKEILVACTGCSLWVRVLFSVEDG